MSCLHGIHEVVLEGFDHELFVVHKKDVFGDRNRTVAVVDGSCGVKKLEALAVALVLGRGILDEGVLEEAVELAGPDGVLCLLADLLDGLEDVLNLLTQFRRDTDEGGVGEEEKFVSQVGFRFFKAR